MIRRRLHNQLTELLARVPAVGLLAPRQVGKTTLALQIADQLRAVYLDLDSAADRAKLADPELYLAEHGDKLVILDEGHRSPWSASPRISSVYS